MKRRSEVAGGGRGERWPGTPAGGREYSEAGEGQGAWEGGPSFYVWG